MAPIISARNKRRKRPNNNWFTILNSNRFERVFFFGNISKWQTAANDIFPVLLRFYCWFRNSILFTRIIRTKRAKISLINANSVSYRVYDMEEHIFCFPPVTCLRMKNSPTNLYARWCFSLRNDENKNLPFIHLNQMNYLDWHCLWALTRSRARPVVVVGYMSFLALYKNEVKNMFRIIFDRVNIRFNILNIHFHRKSIKWKRNALNETNAIFRYIPWHWSLNKLNRNYCPSQFGVENRFTPSKKQLAYDRSQFVYKSIDS